MIKLRLNTTYLDLDGSPIDISIFNPLFDADGAEALFSLPFKLPATPTNLHALNQATRLDNADNTTTYTNAVLEIDGIPFEHGVLELDGQAFDQSGISAVFKNLTPNIFEELEQIKINKILETITLTTGAPEDVFIFSQTAPSPALFQVSIGGNQYSYNPPGGTLPSAIAENLANQINVDFPGVAIWTPGADTFRISSANIDELGFNLAQFNHITIFGFVTSGQRSQLLVQAFVNDISFAPDERVSFPYLHWRGFYKGGVANYSDRINPWVDGDFISNTPTTTQLDWRTTFVPLVRLPYIFQRIADTIPQLITDYQGWYQEADPQALLVFNNRSLDKVYSNRYEDGEFRFINGFNPEIDLNRHVPSMTAKQLLLDFMSQFALYIKPVGTSIIFVKKRDQLTSPPIDWTQLCEPGYVATRKRRRGFTLDFPDIRNEDKKFFNNDGQLEAHTSGEGFNEYELPAGSAKVSSNILTMLPVSGYVKCPSIEQMGSSDEGSLGDTPYSFRLLFDRGIKPTDTSDNYVMATHGNTDINDNPAGTLTLDLNAADGLYHLHHKGIPELLADGQPVTLAMRLSIADILTVRKWTNARRTITLPEGQVTAVIKSIKFKVDAKGLGVSLVEFVQEK